MIFDMFGWVVPPPKKPEKTRKEFLVERKQKVEWLIREGFLKSQRIIDAMLKVPREEFIPEMYRDYAYHEVPLPLPGRNATISCPHSYPLFYESLELGEGNDFMEVGTGSGYGAAIAMEVVGESGKVVTVEIDEETYVFAERNLERLQYRNITAIHGDGSLGYLDQAPYDKICVTASCPKVPEPLIHQLKPGGRLIAPIGSPMLSQDLVLLERREGRAFRRRSIEKVLYVPLKGKHGWL